MCEHRHSRSFKVALEELDTLTTLQKRVIQERYIPLLNDYQKRAYRFAVIFHTCRMIITVGSLIVPALLSIQYTGSNPGSPEDFSFRIYWTTWFLSLFVTTSNGILTLFKIDKKYFLHHTTLEQLRSEGWQYLALTGKYSGFRTPTEHPTHQNQFLYFCHAVEKIKMKQVEEEYFRINDTQQPTPTAVQGQPVQQANQVPQLPFMQDTAMTTRLLPPTPLNPIVPSPVASVRFRGEQETVLVESTPTVDGQREDQNSEVSVRPEVSAGTDATVSVLPAAQGQVPARVTTDRIGTEVRTQ